jgi:CDP-paratose 2-epimerase
MNIALITGSSGLIGSEAVIFFKDKFDLVIGIDNDGRAYFFGANASTKSTRNRLIDTVPNYKHFDVDIRNVQSLETIFKKYASDIKLVIHTAAQPSHDWAAREPFTDFSVNANGTLNILEMCRQNAPSAVFIFTSTNKVYGDTPNYLPLNELENRWELDPSHFYYERGIDETMSIDQTKHSLFGASKVAADVLVQEYGKYFGMRTGVFRGGCLTGPNHAGTQLHGFLSYLVKCAILDEPYTIFGYKGKQVRDNIHSFDLVNMFWHFYQAPRNGEVYNAGGGRFSNCSMLEAIDIIKEISGKQLNYSIVDDNRIGDHIWWISDLTKFKTHYPDWSYKYNITDIIGQIIQRYSTI